MTKNVLGIVGGGQLGMFICNAAKKIGVKTIVFSNAEEFSAKNFCDDFFIGSFNDKAKIQKFVNSAELFTIETENIPKEFCQTIEHKKKLFPSSKIIEITQNRLKEKNFLNNLNTIKTAKYFEINNFSDLVTSAKKLNHQCILKTQEFGYDGKGQFQINKTNLNDFATEDLRNSILEEKINFKLEISVIVVSNGKEFTFYPPVENFHKDSILRESIYPARINPSIEKDSINKAKIIANNLNLNGILAIEMFLTHNQELLINELAPRPHNSGHWTMDSCKFSQFDNLVSLIMKKRVLEPKPFKNCKMINIIGKEFQKFNEINNNFKVYDYFKKDIRPSRKMGHYIVFE